MCGIGGILRVHTAGEVPPPEVAIPESWLDTIDAHIKHRGPDGQGRFRDRTTRPDGSTVDVALVHRRMGIIDLAGGSQPMVSERGRDGEGLVAVVFNGCIYNHRQLRGVLKAAGHRFTTDHSDTEVLIHGWRQWGKHLFEHTDAMLAAALWDRRAARLTLARDRFGEKPLYTLVAPDSAAIAFASTVPALTKLAAMLGAEVSTSDRATLIRPWIQFGWNQWLVGSPICEWMPGLAGTLQDDGRCADGGTFFGFDCLNPSGAPLTLDGADQLIRDAVESRLEADVPLGLFLSGGLDSSLIAAHVTRVRPDVAAYTVRMPVGGLDESKAAAAVAASLNIRHHILDCNPNPSRDLVDAITQLGLPFGDSSLLPSLWVSRAARQEVKVALAGDGGDEMFLGYNRHRAIHWLAALGQLPDYSKRLLARTAPSAASHSRAVRHVGRLLNAAAHNGYKDLVAIFPPPLDADIGLASSGEFGWGEIAHRGMTSPPGDEEWVARLALRFDRQFYLPCDLLRKSDTASMSVALEVRSPFLSRDLADACVNAPMDDLMPNRERKGLLKEVARRYLPAAMVNRPKQGFAIPIGEWFRTDYGGMKSLLLDHLKSADPWPNIGIELNRRFVTQMLDEHMAERRDHSQRLYMLLVLSIWAKWAQA